MIFFIFHLWGQKDYNLSLKQQNFPKSEKYNKKTFKSKNEVLEELESIQFKHRKKGYVLASVDSLVWNEQTADVYYYLGPQFDQITISIANEHQYLLRKVPRVSEKQLLKTPFQPQEVAIMLSGIITYLQNNGHPFAKVWLEVERLDPKDAAAILHIDKGAEVKITEIHLKGEGAEKVGKVYIKNFISIQEGDLYDESRVAKISSRIRQIQFIDEIKPSEILFTPDGAEVFLYLESNPVSLINGVVGLQPNPVTGENVFTGDVRLKLQNILNKGELLDVNWRSLQPETQDLNLQLSYPFLFNSPFGIDGSFDLYRRDSTFLTTVANVGIQYFMKGGNYLKVFYEAENSNLLSGAGNNINLPNTNFSSVSSNQYGLGFYRRQLDYLPNPSKGLELSIDGLIGRRSSRRPDADTSSVVTTYALRANISWYIPLTRRHVIKLANRSKMYYAPEIFVNELYRFGGLTTMRGFDEEELFSSSLTTFSVEYRFLVDQNSHAFAFFDQAFYENSSGDYYKDNPFGVGAGFSFGTNIGVFSISYGIGKQFDNPMLLRNGKVHFGYVSFF